MLFLGIDLGSSSVKLSVLDGETGRCLGSTFYPESELAISSPEAGFAEQDPEIWWQSVKSGCHKLFAQGAFDPKRIASIGISYQMHGLVMVDRLQQALHPAIIWCDSRASTYGESALADLGADYCFGHLLNSPGNFTAAKLRWIQLHQPKIFNQIHKIMLPGDFIAMKLTGEINTTAAGLSEATLWDFKNACVATELLDHWGVSSELVPEIVPSFGYQGTIKAAVADELGLNHGIKVCYRAGDQPNNAFSLQVLEAGQIAATAGTSGVIYGVTDALIADKQSRVNTFMHPTYSSEQQLQGVLLCINGCGRLYAWLRSILGEAGNKPSYTSLNNLAEAVAIGSEGLIFHPFGNGSERIFNNKNIGAQLRNLDFNRHQLGHLVRAAQEGIVFSLNQGFSVLQSLGGSCDLIRAANGNLFSSDVFAHAFANTTQTVIELYATDGATGAARGAALGYGFYSSTKDAFKQLTREKVIEPNPLLFAQYQDAYHQWQSLLNNQECM